MSTLLTGILVLLSVMHGPARETREYHAVMTTMRTYMDASRQTRFEYWFTSGKTCITNGRVTTLVRNDLGLVYTLINSTNVYYVDSLKPAGKAPPSTPEPDFRYVGVGRLNPEYDWMVTRDPKADTTGLYGCTCYLADGDADFDQVTLRYWVSRPANREMALLFNKIMINGNRSIPSRKPMIDCLVKNRTKIPEKFIELVDNPIAPPIRNVVVLEKLEIAKAPGGIFDLPPGARKAK